MEFIAEIGQAHNGNFKIALKYVKALAKTGVNTIKFQVHIAEAESSVHEPFRTKNNVKDKTRFDYWKRMEFSTEEWNTLKIQCEDLGMRFLASPFSNAAVDVLEKIGVERYKIGSGEVNNFLLLEKIARTGKPVILSSGMSSYSELDKTVEFLKKRNIKYSILQCTTAYPTQPKNYGLNLIEELKTRYGIKIGFSDHSAKIETCIAAAALGAEILEFHTVFSRNSFGPDASSSLEINEIEQLVTAVKNIERARGNPVDKSDNSTFSKLKNIFEKSLAINKDLPMGHPISFEDLEAKKPKGHGIAAEDFENVIGKTLVKDKKQWDFLNEANLE